MSSRTLVEMVCDRCACVETFVCLERNQTSAVGKIDLPATLDRLGWSVQKLEGGSNLLVLDYCPVCTLAGRSQRNNP